MRFYEGSDCNTLYLVSRNKLYCILLPLTGFFFYVQFWVRESTVLLVLSSTVGTKRKLLLVVFVHKIQTTVQNIYCILVSANPHQNLSNKDLIIITP